MTSLPLIFRVQAQYTDDDQSRFRAAIMVNTLSVSLREQTDKNFQVMILQEESDKQRAKRRESFGDVILFGEDDDFLAGDDDGDYPRIIVDVPDDDFLHKDFVKSIREMELPDENCFITVPHGYCLHQSKLRIFRNQPDRLLVLALPYPDQTVRKVIDGPQGFMWIHTRHNYSDVLETKEMTTGIPVASLNWPGWNQKLIGKYCEVQLKSATSAGVTVQFPRRVVYAGKRSKQKGMR